MTVASAFTWVPYDRTQPLTIDPVFVFSTYLDGSNQDNVAAVQHPSRHRSAKRARSTD
jgi:hypothetical protein